MSHVLVGGVALKHDAECSQGIPHPPVRQGSHLRFALGQVHPAVVGIEVPGMAGDLVPPLPDLMAKDALKTLYAHVAKLGDPPLPLAVEATDEVHAAISSQRNTECGGQLREQVAQALAELRLPV